MNKWYSKLGFVPDDPQEFDKKFKELCPPGMKLVWKHITRHVLPKEEAAIIRKQCLLHALKTSNNKIPAGVSSLNDYKSFLKAKADQENLNSVKRKIEEKKKSIRELLEGCIDSRNTSSKREEEFGIKAFKLAQLQKKKKTTQRLMEDLRRNNDLMKTLIDKPGLLVDFGPNMTEWEYEILDLVKSLPPGKEYEAIHSKLSQLSLNINPPSEWDRTQLIFSAEESFLSSVKKLKSSQLALKEKEDVIEDKINSIKTLLNNEGAPVEVIEGVMKELDSLRDEILRDALEAGGQPSQPPYTLEMDRNSCRWYQRQIDEKADKINKLLPLGGCEDDSPVPPTSDVTSPLLDLPLELPVDRLFDSLLDEVSLFMKMPLASYEEANFKSIHFGLCFKNQLYKLKDDMKKYSDSMSLLEHLSNSSNAVSALEFQPSVFEIPPHIQDSIRTSEELISEITKIFDHMKSSFNFWRMEPLDDKLTGFEIEGEDVKTWLHRYHDTKVRLDHEEWLSNENNGPSLS